MIAKSLQALVASAVLGLAAFGGSVAPAEADGLYFGFQVGERAPEFDLPRHRYGQDFGWRADRAWDRGWSERRRYDRDWDRGWRPRHERRVVEVCEPVWRVRRVRDDYGQVVRVIRVRQVECRQVWR